MTPEEAQGIYHKACKVEYYKHVADYSPVNQNKVTLAGFRGVIEAVQEECTVDFVHKYFNVNP